MMAVLLRLSTTRTTEAAGGVGAAGRDAARAAPAAARVQDAGDAAAGRAVVQGRRPGHPEQAGARPAQQEEVGAHHRPGEAVGRRPIRVQSSVCDWAAGQRLGGGQRAGGRPSGQHDYTLAVGRPRLFFRCVLPQRRHLHLLRHGRRTSLPMC